MRAESFEAWLTDPVTKWVFAGIKKAQAAELKEWIRLSWDEGNADQHNLTVLRTRAEALGELIDNDFETWSVWND